MAVRIVHGDCREVLPTLEPECFDCIVTSPPYWGLRDYGVEGQIGLEPTLDAYVETMVAVGRELWRVLKPEGTFWLNLGDSYASAWVCNRRNEIGSGSLPAGKRADRPNRLVNGLKEKDLCGVPWRVAFALQANGWWLRSAIVWHKPNPMPESVTDRPTSAYEMVFLLTKAERYFYDADAIAEPASLNSHGATNPHAGAKQESIGQNQGGSLGVKCSGMRNARNVWTMATQPFSGAHFATMPPDLAERCIKAGCPEFVCSECGHVLDSHIKDTVRTGTNGNGLCALRSGVSKASVASDTNEILQSKMRIGSKDADAKSDSLRKLRGASDLGSQEPTETVLQCSLPMQTYGEESPNDEGVDDHDQGVCDDSSARSSESNGGWVRDGASARHGKGNGASPSAHRSRSSQGRQPEAQLTGKPGSSDEAETRPSAESPDGQDPLPSLRGGNSSVPSCPRCKANLARVGAVSPGQVLDPFGGAGTTGLVADRLGRNATLIELNPAYRELAADRTRDDAPLFAQVTA